MFFITFSCGDSANESNTSSTGTIVEQSQQLGEVMSSVDEAGGNTGSFAFYKLPKRSHLQKIMETFVIAPVYAATCNLASSFGTCTNNVITRSFDNCTLFGITFDGTIQLTYDDATTDNVCAMTTAGHSITRQPNFSISNGVYTYTATTAGSNGQVITQTGSNTYTFSNDGTRRVVTDASNGTVYDFSSATTSDLGITGASRDGRVIDGGTIRITNNRISRTCDYSPENVTYDSTCNCAVSGIWNGSCSDGSTAELEITGCGEGTITVGSLSDSVSFDRCYDI